MYHDQNWCAFLQASLTYCWGKACSFFLFDFINPFIYLLNCLYTYLSIYLFRALCSVCNSLQFFSGFFIRQAPESKPAKQGNFSFSCFFLPDQLLEYLNSKKKEVLNHLSPKTNISCNLFLSSVNADSFVFCFVFLSVS